MYYLVYPGFIEFFGEFSFLNIVFTLAISATATDKLPAGLVR